MAIRIVTDSTAYLEPENLAKYNISVVPLQVSFGDTTFKEGQMYSNAEYYKRLKSEKYFPTTSQPSVGDFLETFRSFPPDDTIICIVISELLSGTIQSAEIAGESAAQEVTVIDSRSSASGLAFQVLRAAEMAQAGADKDDIIEEVIRIRSSLELFIVVSDLEYLIRGGRLGKASGLVGTMLQIKPILRLVDGQLVAYDKVRTKQRALDRILTDLQQKHETQPLEQVSIAHVDALEEALAFKERVQEIFHGSIRVSEQGPVIGSHTGPGTIALIYY